MKLFWRIVGRLLGLTLVLVLMALAYLHVQGFPPFLQRRLVQEFARAGLAARFSSIRLDLFRGVVATEAVLADVKAPESPLARIDEVQLQINWRRLVRRQFAVGALRISNAIITVPTPPDELGRAEFSAADAYAILRFQDDGTIVIDHLSGVYCGIRLFVTGRLKLRAASAPRAAGLPPADKGQFLFVTRVVRELNRLSSATAPQLDLDFDVDLGRPLEGQARVRLHGVNLQYRGAVVQSAAVEVAMVHEAIEIQQLRVRAGDGELNISGRYDIAHGSFDLRLDCSATPRAFKTWLPPQAEVWLNDVVIYDKPKISARYFLAPETGPQPRLQGSIETGPLQYRNVEFRAISFSFDSQWPEIRICDAAIETAEGRLTGSGQFQAESSDFSYEFDSTLDPVRLLPILPPVMKRIVEPSWFESPPHVVASVTGDFVDPEVFAYDARITAGRCRYRGVALTGAAGTLRLRRERLAATDVVLSREDGDVRGRLLADFHSHRTQFDMQSTTSPSPMAGLIGDQAALMMQPYGFGSNLAARAAGTVDFDRPAQTTWTAHAVDDQFTWRNLSAKHAEGDLVFTNNHLDLQFQGNGVQYAMFRADRASGSLAVATGGLQAQIATEGFGLWKLLADRARGTLAITNNVLRVDDFTADIYGGTMRGRTEVSLAETQMTYQVEIGADHWDVQKLVPSLRREGRAASGSLKGHVQFQGQGTDLRSIQGRGDLDIAEGILMELPLFGIFSRILDTIAAGLGTTKATRAKATFTIADNAVKSDDIEIAAGAFTLNARGHVTLDGRLDFRVQATFLKAVPGINIAAAILGKILEYKVGGTLDDPSYRPVHLPKEMLPHND